MISRILIVDDEPGILEVCSDTLCKLSDVEIVTEQDSRNAHEKLISEPFDLLIADIRMPGINGVELLRLARKHTPDLIVIMLTAFPTVDTAVECMKLGAVDYITKPFHPEKMRAMVSRLLVERKLLEENRLLRRQVEQGYRMGEMLGQSPAMQKVFDTIKRIASTDIDVLILGETGTGKELVARNVHKQSSRKNERFVPIDCGAIPEDLLESELFGHEKGAFTGAGEKSMGLLEFADKGTFFLDEVGNLPQKLQAKLLRVLQERKFRRVGGSQEIDINLRLIAATSLDLDSEISKNRFRMDLFYRINVGRVELPPLRDRESDVTLLTSHFIRQNAAQMNKEDIKIDPEVFEVLNYYQWPGNVRELQNIVKRMLAMSRNNRITVDDLPDEIVVATSDHPMSHNSGFFNQRGRHMAHFERQYLSKLLKSTQGDVSQAAELARIPRGTFYRLLKRNQLDPDQFR